MIWTDGYCSEKPGNVFVYERKDKRLIEVDTGGMRWWVSLTPSGQIALGDFGADSLLDPLTFATVVSQPGKKIVSGALTLEPVEVKHDPGLILSLGYTCELGGHRFGYTGDSAMCDGVRDIARASEVLVAECASFDKNLPVHMNFVDDMSVLRAAMNPEARLVLTHTEGAMETGGLARATAARDFERYRF